MKKRNSDKRVCVLMSSYNGEAFIKEQIESILNQSCEEISLLIRDDGSSDRTVDIVESMKSENITLYKGSNIGVQKSFSKLIKTALDMKQNFQFFAFADQDDVWESGKLVRAVEKLNGMDMTLPCMYFSNLEITDEKLNHVGYVYKKKQKRTITKKTSLVRNYAYGCTMVFNRAAAEKYREGMHARMWMHDYWMFLICMFLGQYYFDRRSYIRYRQHGNNSVGIRKNAYWTIRTKIKSFQMLSTHPREDMSRDFKMIYGKLLKEQDLAVIEEFLGYRKSIGKRFKAVSDKDYMVYPLPANLALKIRFLIGAV